MNWTDSSEIVFGLVLEGRLPPGAVTASLCEEPYNRAVLMLQDGAERADLLDKIGIQPIENARRAMTYVNGSDPTQYLAVMEKAAYRTSAAKRLKRLVGQLERGQDIDLGVLNNIAHDLSNDLPELVPMSEVRKMEGTPMVPTFYKPIPFIPDALPTIIAGPTGGGKTSLLAKIATSTAKHGKKAALFSLEMTLAQVLMRLTEIGLEEEEEHLILGSDRPYYPDEIYASVVRSVMLDPDIYWVGIDYADLLQGSGESRAGSMDAIYRMTARLAKEIRRPVLVVTQINDDYRVRWSRAAEHVAGLIVLPYNPNTSWFQYPMWRETLPTVEGHAYLIYGKARFGFNKTGHGDQSGTFAVQVPWGGQGEWGNEVSGVWRVNVNSGG